MSDAREYEKIAKMDALALLNYVCAHPYYLTDSYYKGFDKNIYTRLAILNRQAEK